MRAVVGARGRFLYRLVVGGLRRGSGGAAGAGEHRGDGRERDLRIAAGAGADCRYNWRQPVAARCELALLA